MLTLKLISEETERVVKGLEKKHFPNAREAVEKVLEYDKIRREAQQKLDNNKQQANQFAKQIGAPMKSFCLPQPFELLTFKSYNCVH